MELIDTSKLGFIWTFERFDRNGRLIDVETVHNIIPEAGRNHILDVVLHAGQQVTTWYVGLFEGNYTPISSNTAANFPGLATECTAYDEPTRREFTEAAASGGSITNSANRAEFTFNASKTIYGAFLTSVATKGATTGTLLSAVRFGTAKTMAAEEILRVAGSLSLTSS